MRLSLLGLFNYDPTVLDGVHIPAGADVDTLKTLLLAETAELEILYPRPDVFKIIFSAWNESRYAEWARIWEAMRENYDPLHNYDRHEEYTTRTVGNDSTSGQSATETRSDSESTENRNVKRDLLENDDETITGSISETTQHTGTVTDSGTSHQQTDTSVAGFNSGSLTSKDRTVTDGTTGSTRTDALTDALTGSNSTTSERERTEGEETVTRGAVTNELTGSESETNSTDFETDRTTTHTAHLYGNIGVTTSAQMLEGEIDIRSNDFYKIYITEFRRRFCLLVY